MTFEEFVKLADADKIVLCEVKFPVDVHSWTWTSESGSYSTPFSEGEVTAVQEDEVELAAAASKAACDATAGSFFYDFAAAVLYVHTRAGDSPGAVESGPVYKYVLRAFYPLCFVDRQGRNDNRVTYVPRGAVHAAYYHPLLDSAAFSEIVQSVGEYNSGEISISFGTLSFFDPAFFYRSNRWDSFHNLDARLLIGQRGSAYADLREFFSGTTKRPAISDERFTVGITDSRLGGFGEIPPNKYSLDDYPNLEPSLVGSAIPILIGEVDNIPAHCIDTVNHVWKIHDGDAFGDIEAVTAVRADDTTLTLTTEYTVDLAKGEITILAAIANAAVRVDAKGAKCDMVSGAYSSRAADLLRFLLVDINAVPASKIDAAAFLALKAARTQRLGWWFSAPMPTLDAIAALQRSALFQFVPLLDGTYTVVYYEAGIPSGTPTLDVRELSDINLAGETEKAYPSVILGYGYNPGESLYLYAVAESAKTANKYKQREPLRVDTWLVEAGEAATAAAFYIAMYGRPPRYLDASTRLVGLDYNPADQFIVDHSIRDTDGLTVQAVDSLLFRLLRIGKGLAAGDVTLHAIESDQSAGSFHTDIAYQDYYSDTGHADYAHEDETYNDHGDGHGDVAHEDVPHIDQHEDMTHADHDDMGYDDYGYIDEHVDQAHTDVAHADAAHEDESHSDYTDVEHGDAAHVDQYFDIEYQDSEI